MLTILANVIPHFYTLVAYFIYTQPLRDPHALSLFALRAYISFAYVLVVFGYC